MKIIIFSFHRSFVVLYKYEQMIRCLDCLSIVGVVGNIIDCSVNSEH